MKVVLDMDIGVDDALALALAILSPELEVLAVTTVAGNAPVRECTRNCLLLLELLQELSARTGSRSPAPALSSPDQAGEYGIEIPLVAEGASAPLVKDLVTAPEVHGEDGLGGTLDSLPDPVSRPIDEPAHELLARLARESTDEVTLVTTGPLTNIAMALDADARAVTSYERVLSMGGAFRVPGNTGPVAEFNVYVDPEAAHAVFSAGLNLTLVPLDVTTRAVLMRNALAKEDTARPVGDTEMRPGRDLEAILRRALDYYIRFQMGESGLDGGFMHDPLTLASSFRPSVLSTSRGVVRVETDGPERGRTTVCQTDEARAIEVAVGVDERAFGELLRRRVIEPIFGGRGAA